MRGAHGIVALALASACYRGHGDGAGEGAANGSGAEDGSGSDAGSSGGDDTGAAACVDERPGPTHLRRLSASEYRGSIAVLLGAGLPDPTVDFPDDAVVGGFDNNAEALATSDLHVERWRDAAEQLAAAVIADPDRRAGVVGCDPTGPDRDACLEAFARRFGRLAWRHTLDYEEIAGLLAVADAAAADADPWAAIALVIEAVLQSPSFVFRVELGEPDPQVPERIPLRGVEVATRLSLLLVGATPSAELLDLAEAGGLADAEGVEAAAHELLADPRAVAALREFHGQWLQLPVLEHVARDPAVYPAWTPTLGLAMAESTRRLVDEHVWSEGADFLDVLVADHAWLDAELAALYDVAVATDDFESVQLPAGQRRSGILGQASTATVTGKNDAGLAIFRGKFIREVLLCESLPPPPQNVPAIPDPVAGESDQERLSRHRSDPACSGCHALLDPLGFGLAELDAIGRWRELDSTGAPVDARGSRSGWDGYEFDGAVELAALLRSDPAVADCVVRQLFRWSAGRRETDADTCTLDALATEFEASDHSLLSLLVVYVRSDAFRYREPASEGP